MHLVKLHATESTNDELRARLRESDIPHLTALYTVSQTNGRGNRGTVWQSETGKNLTFSVLISEYISDISPFELNQIVSVAMVEWLKMEWNIQAKIKWPNDILSVQKKLAGILIENTFSKSQWTHSIIGIGLNVNQEFFDGLPKAISLKNITGKTYNLEELLLQFLSYLDIALHDKEQSIEKYVKYFFKYQQEVKFEIDHKIVIATVKGVNKNGELLLEKEGQITAYELKQVRWIY